MTMEVIKDLTQQAKDNHVSVKAMDTTFAKDFHSYMKESFRRSRNNSMKAIKSASSVIINK